MTRSRRPRRQPATAPSPPAPASSPTEPTPFSGNPQRIAAAGVAAYALLAAAHLAAGWAPDPRAWGVHAVAFLPRVAWITAFVLCIALLAPRIASGFGNAVLRATAWVLESWVRIGGLALVAGVLFVLLRLRFQFLGDGVVWLEKIEHRQAFHHFEPLATAVVSRVAQQDPRFERGAAWPSIAAGIAYVVATAGLCRALWRDAAGRALGWCLLLLHPLLLLFFGYVESYPVLLVLQVVFAWALLGGGRVAAVLATGILAIAIAWHLQALAWLPALVLWWWVRRRERRERDHGGSPGASGRALASGLAAGALAVAAAIWIVRAVGASPRRLLAELGGESGLGSATLTALLSARHLVDLANEAVLVLGPVLVLAVAALASGRRPLAGRWGIGALLLAGPALFAFLVVPRIGGARDWDLYLTLVVPATLLAVEAWRRIDAASRTRKGHPPSVPAALAGRAIGLALVATVAYLAVQLDAARAARRMETLLEVRGTFGNFARGYANETLGMYYREHDLRAARDAYARAVEANPVNPRYYNNLGNAELRLQNVEAARDAFQRASQLGMKEWFVLHNLGVAELQMHRPEAAEPVFEEIVQRWPDRWLGHACLAQTRIELGRPGDALPEIERARALAPGEADVHYFHGLALRDLGRRAESRKAFAAALRLDPRHSAAQRALDALGEPR